MDSGNSAVGPTTEPSRIVYVAADTTNMPRNASIDEKTDVGFNQTEETRSRHRNVTQVEHARINEAIATGIAENVDDFMVSD